MPGSFCGEAVQTAALLQGVLACHSLAKKKNVHRSRSDMIDCSDLPSWVLLRFGFFVCLGFVLWFWGFFPTAFFFCCSCQLTN